MKRKYFAYPYLVWMAALIAAPMLLIVFYAFTRDGAFTLDFMKKALDPMFLTVLARSVEMALAATLICLILGYPISYLLSRMKPSRSAIVSMLFILPMWMNFLLRTYAVMAILDMNGIVNSFLKLLGLEAVQLMYTGGAVIFGMVYNFLPFMILPIYNVLQKIPQANIEAAQDLGADGLTVFRRVIFPLSLPGVVSGITMVFVPAITTFAISRLLGGSQTVLYGDVIENQFLLTNNWNLGSALSVLMLVIVLISMFITNKTDKSGEGGALL